MKTFYITFGQKYYDEPHPKGGHPDGWFVVYAETYDEARKLTSEVLDVRWSHIYESFEELKPEHYPNGQIGSIGTPITVGRDGDHMYALFGEDLQDGDAEFAYISKDGEHVAEVLAVATLCKRLNISLPKITKLP